jgi:hypothetical protein
MNAFHLGIIKGAGYYQNIVGMDKDQLVKFKALRKILVRREQIEEEEDAAYGAYLKSKGIQPFDFSKSYTREQYDAYRKKSDPFSKLYWKDNPSKIDTAMDTLRRLGTEVVPWAGKYNEIPELIANDSEAPLSGEPTGKGYMSKKELLSSPGIKVLSTGPRYREDPDLSKVVQQIKDSPYKYFTSTDIG